MFRSWFDIILMEARIIPGKKLIYLIALIQFCIILSLFLWLYHPGHLDKLYKQASFMVYEFQFYEQRILFTTSKKKPPPSLLQWRSFYICMGPPDPLTPRLTSHVVTAQTIHSARYKTPKNCLQRPRKICCILRQSE